MKILVYGAGVLGCNLARNLFRAGKDVTLLARGRLPIRCRKRMCCLPLRFPQGIGSAIMWLPSI